MPDPEEPPPDWIEPQSFTPRELAHSQAKDTRAFMERVRAGGGLRFPWPDVDRMLGPLLPGWLIAVGGRAKAGKTTMLMDLLTAWSSLGKTVVYVGTETEVALLRYVWGATRCNVPIDTAIDPRCPQDIYDRIMRDVEESQVAFAERAIFADSPDATVDELGRWIEYGREYGASALIFDHFSRLAVKGDGARWEGLSLAIREIKNLAKAAEITVVVGAQLTQGHGGSYCGEHEVPGNGSWAGAPGEIQREIDAGVQLWRPFKVGITDAQKKEARDDAAKVRELVQEGIMGVRLAAHRWGKDANQFCRLVVKDGQISSYTVRMP